MKSYVYVIGDYEEGGTSNVLATLDRSRVVEMLSRFDSAYEHSEERSNLEKILAEPVTAGKWHLSRGWGGVLLYVIEIDAETSI